VKRLETLKMFLSFLCLLGVWMMELKDMKKILLFIILILSLVVPSVQAEEHLYLAAIDDFFGEGNMKSLMGVDVASLCVCGTHVISELTA
jgi:hypothetical protein